MGAVSLESSESARDVVLGLALFRAGEERGRLADLDEPARNLGLARALFARALETPGGIKITTIHALP